MTQVNIDYIEDKNGNKVAPITHVNAVRDSEGNTLPDILDRDYPTTSKTPVEGSTEVSLVTRGEKYNYDKVNNATDVSGASGIGADFKYLLLNGTTGEFEQALESYVNEKVRSAIGALINNLDKGTGVKAVAGIDSNNDLGTITTANLASVLGDELKIKKYICPAGSSITIPYGYGFLILMSRGGGTGAIYAAYAQTNCVKLAGDVNEYFEVYKPSEHVISVREKPGYGSIQAVLVGLQ